jgi:hypothetical protein
MIKFDFRAFTRSFPGVCFMGGLALTIVSAIFHLSVLLIALGVLLMFLSAGLYVLYLYWNRRSDR